MIKRRRGEKEKAVVTMMCLLLLKSSILICIITSSRLRRNRLGLSLFCTAAAAEAQQQEEEERPPKRRRRITLLGLDEILQLERSSIVGLGSDTSNSGSDRLAHYEELHHNDMIEDGFYQNPIAPDPSCFLDTDDDDTDGHVNDSNNNNCWHPPDSTMETEYIQVWETSSDNDEKKQLDKDSSDSGDGDDDKTVATAAGLETLSWGYGGNDPDDDHSSLNVEDRSLQQQQQQQQQQGNSDNQKCSTSDDKENADTANREADNKQSTAATATVTIPPSQPLMSTGTREKQSTKNSKTILVDKHWGSDENILKMRDRLRRSNVSNNSNSSNKNNNNRSNGRNNKENSNNNSNRRPPVFLLPGLASTRLVSWKHKPCPQSPLLSDIKMLDHVWLNMNLLIQMATIDVRCWSECMTLGRYQSDYDDFDLRAKKNDTVTTEINDERGGSKDKRDDDNEAEATKVSSSSSHGCKLRPDEGLDAISSLAPGSISSNLLVGGTNTVYAWLIQWLADNLGYDVTSIVALPYDWRLSPDKMESRDGFLTLMRKKIEAAVEINGLPGIMVAHSMGNSVFRYFLEWLRVQMQEEAYERYVQQTEQAVVTAAEASSNNRGPFWRGRALYRGLINLPGGIGGRGNNTTADVNDLLEEFTRAFESDTISATTEKDSSNQSKENKQNDDEAITADSTARKYPKLWELAKIEGDSEWIDWLGSHVWTYVGLAAPLLGAPGPLRSVLSGENMGLPFTDEEARILELSFGSTTTVHPIPTNMGFCDNPEDEGEETLKSKGHKSSKGEKEQNRNLACLDELVMGIEAKANETYNPWQDYPALRLLLKDRVDYHSAFAMIRVEREFCDENEKSPCKNQTTIDFSAKDVMNGNIFDRFSKIWREENDPLGVKLEQFRDSWLKSNVPNMLESTPDRPHIKHVIMAYGTDVPTEAGYIYRKTDRMPKLDNNATSADKMKKLFDGVPEMHKVIWEEKHGRIIEETKSESFTFPESILRKKKQTRRPLNSGDSSIWLHHSGDGTIPYLSLMWAHTWLLHATRAMRSTNHTTPLRKGERISDPNNALDSIKVSHRPKGGNDWIQGYGADPRVEKYDFESRSNIGDTGTSHPHGTKYKPKMVRFQSKGKSRSTGMEYTTTVIEAIGVEHKETTRNYDILAAAFTDVLKHLHEDYGLV